jgi:hypothetical protein
MVVDGVMIPIIALLIVPVTAIGFPLARAFAKRMERGDAPKIPSDVSARLERMEQAIDSIAVEVERISEGQRFTTKLLAERTSNGALNVAAGAAPGVAPALENPPPRGS